MKIINIIFGTFVSLSVSYGAMTENDFVSVTNDWYRGVYSNVCALASYRESLNSNDVVAAYILCEWNMLRGTKESYSNAIEKVLLVSGQITNATFSAEYAITREDLVHMRDVVIPSVSEERVEADWFKIQYAGKRFTEWRLLKILWDEHLW